MFVSIRHICPTAIPRFGSLNLTLVVPGGIFDIAVALSAVGEMVAPNLEGGNGDKVSACSPLCAKVDGFMIGR